MTISNNYIPFKQIGNGATVDFSPSWDPLVSTNIRVYLEDIISGTQVLITEGGGASQYSLVINAGGSGFTVTFNTAPTSADYIVIVREVSLVQGTNYTTSKGFQGTVLEGSLDKLTAISQDVSDKASRSVKFPEGSSLNGVLPGTPVDGYGLVWDGVSGKIRNTASSLSNLEGDAEIVADNIADIIIVADSVAEITTVSDNIADVVVVSDNIADIADAANAIGSIIKWTFKSNTAMAQPLLGSLRLNNADLSLVTAIAVDNQTAQDGNPDVSDYVASWGVSTSADKGFVRINKGGEAATFAIYKVNASVVDNTGWLQISVAYIDGAGSLSADDDLFVGFSQAGDEGTGTPGDNTVTTAKLVNGSVTNAKISGVNASKVDAGILDEARLPEASTTEKGAVVKATTLNMTDGDADKFPDAEKVKAFVASRAFETSQQTITSDGDLSIAHGLGVIPKQVTAFLVCQTAELGYSVGDWLAIGNHYGEFGGTAHKGQMIIVDSTNIKIHYGDDGASVYRIMSWVTRVVSNITNANWKLVVAVQV